MAADEEDLRPHGVIDHTSAIVAAYVSNNSVPGNDLASVIKTVHETLSGLAGHSHSPQPETHKPAVPVKRSVTPGYLVCLEDGKKLTMLKRYLRTRYRLTPDEYRAKWNLPHDYPMVAPDYSERRSEFAKKLGLGRLPKATRKRRRG
jgi:predicted transcriptional regulator